MRVAIAIFCLALTACVRVPSVSQSEAVGLEAAAMVVLVRGDSSDASLAWPAEIQSIKPKAVRIASDGLYLVTSSWFVEESGLFVPRDPSVFSPVEGSDPEYRRLHGNVFSYRIRG
jgi:hypothetical protein